MECSKCSGPVEWKGPLTDLTHTECLSCGAENAQREIPVEEGGPCPNDGCGGSMEVPPTENCACHINPPCSACMSVVLTCSECHWEDPTNE